MATVIEHHFFSKQEMLKVLDHLHRLEFEVDKLKEKLALAENRLQALESNSIRNSPQTILPFAIPLGHSLNRPMPSPHNPVTETVSPPEWRTLATWNPMMTWDRISGLPFALDLSAGGGQEDLESSPWLRPVQAIQSVQERSEQEQTSLSNAPILMMQKLRQDPTKDESLKPNPENLESRTTRPSLWVDTNVGTAFDSDYSSTESARINPGAGSLSVSPSVDINVSADLRASENSPMQGNRAQRESPIRANDPGAHSPIPLLFSEPGRLRTPPVKSRSFDNLRAAKDFTPAFSKRIVKRKKKLAALEKARLEIPTHSTQKKASSDKSARKIKNRIMPQGHLLYQKKGCKT